jgi:O-acetyl-ADP-ribose deacetylase (regulator of RNase III)
VIKEVRGNLIHAKTMLILHGCNCFLTMGAGVALALRNKWPQVYAADLETKKAYISKLGTYSKAEVGTNQLVLNCYTQYMYGRDKRHADYDAIRAVFKKIKIDFPKIDLSMSPIGCGLAGGDWDVVKQIVEEVFDDRTVYVWRL